MSLAFSQAAVAPVVVAKAFYRTERSPWSAMAWARFRAVIGGRRWKRCSIVTTLSIVLRPTRRRRPFRETERRFLTSETYIREAIAISNRETERRDPLTRRGCTDKSCRAAGGERVKDGVGKARALSPRGKRKKVDAPPRNGNRCDYVDNEFISRTLITECTLRILH
ncbi:unnamed protein product, partial [Iphiclides podalirius]